MMTDPIADMLTRIRNAGMAGRKWVDMPVSRQKVELAKLLTSNTSVDRKIILSLRLVFFSLPIFF